MEIIQCRTLDTRSNPWGILARSDQRLPVPSRFPLHTESKYRGLNCHYTRAIQHGGHADITVVVNAPSSESVFHKPVYYPFIYCLLQVTVADLA